MIASFKYWYSSRLKLNIRLRIWIKTPEEPFITNPGISSNPTGLEGFSHLMALQTSAFDNNNNYIKRK
jgi:hypothetical protein